MPEEIPLSPIGRDEIHKLEVALLIGTLLNPEFIELMKESEERLTWVDSLAVAAAALARERARISIPQIAEELGRSEATIRNHLSRKTRAGQLVWQTYEKFVREGVKLDIEALTGLSSREATQLKSENQELKRKLEEAQGRIKELSQQIQELSNKISSLKAKLQRLLEEL
ncbi:transcriptional regulator [Thermofilum sp.]|uniref:transcriptional regulator n=1 Tax=Thermofilum sp. TaxID=1961369 RepID=UPI003162FF78